MKTNNIFSVPTIGWIFFLSGLIAMIVALSAEFFLHMVPCILCLWERWPWRVLCFLGAILLFISYRYPGKCKQYEFIFSTMGIFCLLISVGLSILHVGVEFNFWASPFSQCHQQNVMGASFNDWMHNMPLRPAKPCDAPDYLFHSFISMTQLAGLYSVGICLLSGYVFFKTFRHIFGHKIVR